MEPTRLTDEFIRKLPLAGKPGAPVGKLAYLVRDTEVVGFLVVVGKSDVSFAYQSEVDGSKRQVIGRFYTDTPKAPKLTVKEARAMAQDQLGGIKTKRIVIARGGVTLRMAWEQYKEHLTNKGRSAGTIWSYGDAIERTLAEWLDRPLRELSENPDEVKAKFHAIAREAAQRRAPPKRGQANPLGIPRAQGVMRVLSAVYGYMLDQDDKLPAASPLRRLKSSMDQKRRQTGLAASELAAWARELHAKGEVNPIRRELHLFLALSGARPEPIKSARWSDIDLRRRVLKITKDKTRPIDVPLSWAMVRCLQRVKRAAKVLFPESPFIFPARSATGHVREIKEDRDDLSKYGNDLRQSLATLSTDVGVSMVHLKILMGHSLGKDVTMGYVNRSKLDERVLRMAQERVSRYYVKWLKLPFDGQAMRPRAAGDE
jgi:integrase